MQIMCSVDKSEIQEHVQARLEAEKEEKERRRREKQEAHLYAVMRLVRDEDLQQQIGHTHWFDLADMDKVRCHGFAHVFACVW
jgi:ubiquitin carboxyl-terminal hydrolase 7